ncbi:DNA polymerase IV, partial [Streptomyces katrae]
EVQRLADRCVGRLRASGHSGRTIVLKVRRYDFSTLTRSETLRGPTDDPAVVREAAARLLEGVDTTGGVRLLGVGVSGLADYTQEDLFAQALGAVAQEAGAAPPDGVREAEETDGVTGAAVASGISGALGAPGPAETAVAPVEDQPQAAARHWPAGSDVRHALYGPGWVQGSGVGRVTVRFEQPGSPPGRVRTFLLDDPELEASDPLPLVGRPDASQP